MDITNNIFEYVTDIYDRIESIIGKDEDSISNILESLYSNFLNQVCVSDYEIESCETGFFGAEFRSDFNVSFTEESDEVAFNFFMGLALLSFLNYYNQKELGDIE